MTLVFLAWVSQTKSVFCHAGNLFMAQNERRKSHRSFMWDIYRFSYYTLFQVRFTVKLSRGNNVLTYFTEKRLTIKSMWRVKDGKYSWSERKTIKLWMHEKELFVSFISVINRSLSSYCHYFSALALNRKLKQRRQQRWRRRVVKNKSLF